MDDRECVVERYCLILRKAVAVQQDVNSFLSSHNMEPRPQSVPRNNFRQVFLPDNVAAVGKWPENRVIHNNRCSRSQGPAIPQINFAGIPPRPPAHLFVAQPCAPPRPRLETSAGAAVVVLARIPVTVVGLWSPRIQQGPGA